MLYIKTFENVRPLSRERLPVSIGDLMNSRFIRASQIDRVCCVYLLLVDFQQCATILLICFVWTDVHRWAGMPRRREISRPAKYL